MAARRFSRLQKCLLAWLAMDEQRTRGMISSSHQELVSALQGDKGNISHSLRTLEARGLLVRVRSRGGKTDALYLTSEGQKWAHQFAGSCDEGNEAREGAGLLRHPPSLAWALLSVEARLYDRCPRKKGVACKMVQSKMETMSNVRINARERWRQYECYIQSIRASAKCSLTVCPPCLRAVR